MSADEADFQGFTRGTLTVRKFFDSLESTPWFYRQSEIVGYIQTWMDGCIPADKEEVLRVARETFGDDVAVMWP